MTTPTRPKVRNIVLYTTSDNYVETTTTIGCVQDATSTEHNGVYMLRKITHKPGIVNMNSLSARIASTIAAVRNQWDVITAMHADEQDAWTYYFDMGLRLTWSSGDSFVFYKINPMTGLPALVDYTAGGCTPDTTFLTRYNMAPTIFDYIKNRNFQSELAPAAIVFSQLHVQVHEDSFATFETGVGTPVVTMKHMHNATDQPQLWWLNTALHMYASDTSLSIADYKPSAKTWQCTDAQNAIITDLDNHTPFYFIDEAIYHLLDEYPPQWLTTNIALAQAMEIITKKLVGLDNYKKHMAIPGDAMNVAMAAAYYCVRPSTNQIRLQTIYTQDSQIMPNDSQAFVRDMTGARTKYLDALQGLISSVAIT